MGIVAFALRYRHTFYVLALMMLFLGGSAILTAPKDIFPNINIPVVTVIWQYTGLTPEEMEQRVTTYSEYSISSNVSDIRNIESQTLSGVAVEKVFFQPNVNVDLAISQIVSASNAIRSLMPVGIQPPVIVQYNASSVPVLQLSLSSDQLNEQQLYDYGIYRIRQALAPIAGITLPTPYGGKYRQIVVDLDPNALAARGITPQRHRQRGECTEPDVAIGGRKDGRHAIYRARQQYGAIDRCPEPNSDQTGRRRDDLSLRRGACAGRLGCPTECCAHRRKSFGAFDHHQERECLDS